MSTQLGIDLGSTVGGYRLESLLGRGGISTVYLARDMRLGRDVALKVVSPELADDERFIRRFRRESRLAAALEHPAVVPVYEAGEDRGVFFIAMRLVRGSDLRVLLAERGPLEPDEAARLLAPIADALDTAHALGLIHRDVKPGNILVAEDGRSYLADFGLAKSTNAGSSLSKTGALVGTVDYVPPEQIRGDELDGRADQYSLACVLFECVTGLPPHRRESELGTLWAHVEEVAPLPSAVRAGLPRALDDAVAVALAKRPAARFRSCAELVARAGTAADETVEAVTPPFMGLAAFEGADARYFFGRERLVAALVERTHSQRIVALVGPSGSGKSSVLRAGLVPALEQLGRNVRVLRPGSDAAAALNALTSTATDDAVVAVDQFEEVFTAWQDERDRTHFVERLVTMSDSVVVSVRADYFGHCARYPQFAELVGGGTVLVGAMGGNELRRVIEGPSARAGLKLEDGLVEAILDDVGESPGALPLLETALLELWRNREGRTLTLAAYEQSGGLRRAVARLAEEAYGSLAEKEGEAARQILLRLADLDESGEAVRRRVRLRELDIDSRDDVARALAVLTAGRLLTVDDGHVEVTHEALFREWPRLRSWLEEDAAGREVRRAVAEGAARWTANGRDAGDLLRGARLTGAVEWAAPRAGELNDAERAYLEASRHAGERDQRRLRLVVATLAALLVAAILAGVVALTQRQAARRAARVALAGQLGAEAVSEPRIDRAMLLAREAVALADSPRTAGTLLATLQRSPAALGTFTLPIETKPYKLTLSPDGKTIVVADQQGALRFYDAATHQPTRPVVRDVFGYVVPAYSTDGRLLVTVAAAKDGPPPGVELRDAKSLRRLRFLRFDAGLLSAKYGAGPYSPLGVTPDGRIAFVAYDLADASFDERAAFVDFWDVRSGQRRRVRLTGDNLLGARLVGNTRLVTITGGAIETWDIRTLRRLRVIRPQLTPFGGAGFADVSPDGRLAAAVSSVTKALVFVDSRTGREVQAEPGGHDPGAIHFVRFSPDNRTAVSTGSDRKVILWDATTGRRLETLEGHGGDVTGAAFSADGRTLYTSSLDGAIFEWDVGGARRFGRPFHVSTQPHELPGVPQTPPLAVAADSQSFAYRVGNDRVGVLSLTTMRAGAVFGRGPGAVAALAWSPNAPVVAVARSGGVVDLWRLDPRPRLVQRLRMRGPVQAVAFAPDGREVAAVDSEGAAAAQGRVEVWSARTGAVLAATRLPAAGSSVAYSSDGRRLAVGAADHGVLIVDPATGRTEHTVHPIGLNVSAAFAGNRTLLTGSFQATVERWDTSTGAPIGTPARVAAGPVADIAVAPGGGTFGTSSLTEGAVRLWTVDGLHQFGGTFDGPAGTLTAAAITPDGRDLIVLPETGDGVVWPISEDDWQRRACSVAGRNFSQDEWSQFVAGHRYARTCPEFPSARATS